MQRLAKRDVEQADKVHDLLQYLYPGFSEDLSNYPNVEGFLNLAEKAKEFHQGLYRKQAMNADETSGSCQRHSTRDHRIYLGVYGR